MTSKQTAFNSISFSTQFFCPYWNVVRNDMLTAHRFATFGACQTIYISPTWVWLTQKMQKQKITRSKERWTGEITVWHKINRNGLKISWQIIHFSHAIWFSILLCKRNQQLAKSIDTAAVVVVENWIFFKGAIRWATKHLYFMCLLTRDLPVCCSNQTRVNLMTRPL